MSAENVAVVRTLHERWRRHERVDDLLDERIEYVNPPDAIEPGTRVGRSALTRILDIYPDFTIEVEDMIDAGAQVVVIGIASGTSASGVHVHSRQGYVWTVRDGRIVRFCWHLTAEQALAAAGLSE